MALSPTEVLQQRQTRKQERTAALETLIDGFLAQGFDLACTVDVDASWNRTIFDEVLAKYRGASWHVEVSLDFHGNRQVVFTPPSG